MRLNALDNERQLTEANSHKRGSMAPAAATGYSQLASAKRLATSAAPIHEWFRSEQ